MANKLTGKQRSILLAKQTLFILWTIIKWLIVFGLVGGFLAAGLVAGYVTALVRDEPVRAPEDMLAAINQYSQTGFVYFNDGTLIGQLRSSEDRRLVESIKEIPQHVRDAFISVEDFRFERHFGIDIIGTLRAAKQKFLNEDTQTGGSTITQQLARRVFLSLEQTDARKFKEIFLAMRMERIMTKDDILLAYLNKMPFGNGSSGYQLYGIKSAAKGIFDVDDLSDLNIAQAAYLAGLLKAPSDYSAFDGYGRFDEEGFDKAMNRQKVVLSAMLKTGAITQKEYEEALKFNVKATLAETKQKAYTTYPYLMIEAERRAAEQLLLMANPGLTEQDLRKKEYASLVQDAIEWMNRSGYRIYTTIDKEMYDAMQEIAKNPENFSPDHPDKGMEQTGAIMIDNKTGRILAMIEGRDYYTEQLNHATQMTRQPGSAMKLFAYLPALEAGITQPGWPIDDMPIVLKDGSKGAHVPVNHDGKYHGLITARRAFNQSYNIPALKLFLSEHGGVGIETAWDYAKRMGITTLTDADYLAQTGVIGGLTNGVTVEELTNAYSVIPNGGVFRDAYLIERIEDADGNEVFRHLETPETIVSEESAYLMMDMMRTVLTDGTGGLARRNFKYANEVPIFGKTGTTSNDHDVWFVGFSPDITVGVWTGYDQPAKLDSNGTQRSRLLWATIMNTAYELKPEWFVTKEVEKPANVISATLSAVSGKLPNELTRESGLLTTDLINKKFLPTQEEDKLVKARVVRYQGANYFAKETTPDDFVQEKVVVLRDKTNHQMIEELKATFEQFPKSVPSRSSLKNPENFRTPDADLDAPTETDPRTDDGIAPPAPTNLTLELEDGNYRLRFNPSPADDVVGYRVYLSRNYGPFYRLGGIVAYAGDEPTFLIAPRTQNDTLYITAVDVAGKESQPSNYVFSGDAVDDSLLPPPLPSDPGTDLFPGLDETDPTLPGGIFDPGAGTGGGSQIGPGDPSSDTERPTAPEALTVRYRDGGIGIVLEWRANPAAQQVTQYVIYYADSSNSQFIEIGTTSETRFEYISFPAEGFYRVVAVNGAGRSAPSTVELRAED